MEKVVFTCMESVRLAELLEDVRGIEGVIEDINVVELYFDELKITLQEVYDIIFEGILNYSDGKGTVYFSRVYQFDKLKNLKLIRKSENINIMSAVG